MIAITPKANGPISNHFRPSVVIPLDIELADVFARVAKLPNCLWLDSASDHQFDRGRYSFLTADPVAWCDASMASPNPWPVLSDWCRNLKRCQSQTSEHAGHDLPPFRGGIAGLVAYEAAWWLEPSLRPIPDTDSPRPLEQIPGMAIGLYDWTLATDHLLGTTWLLSTGLDELFEVDHQRAQDRADRVLKWIENPTLKSRQTMPVPSLNGQRPLGQRPLGQRSLGQRPLNLKSNFTDESFASGVAEIIRRISAGDSFQVNLAQTLSHPATCESIEFYQRLREINPAPYGCFFDAGDYQVMSSSPEGFLQVRGNEVVTRPIKGTVRRTGNDDDDQRLGEMLVQSEKDRAENIMIVDLMRNDLSRVCTDASVRVDGLCELEKYQRVQHLVSTVRGTLRNDAGVADLLAACFPGGSITGAPKVEAMRTIADLERQPRGPYCGSIGYVSLGATADFNILIRTITQRRVSSAADDEPSAMIWEFPVGGGITARSEPVRETEETWVKAASLLEAISASG